MKKSTIYLIISLFVAFNFVYSQKPNTKKISIPYIQSPLNPLNKNIEKYISKVVNYSTMFQISNSQLNLKGYEKVTSIGEADLEIKFIINNAYFESKVFKAKYKKKVNDSTYVDAEGGKYRIDAIINVSEQIKDLKNNKLLISNEGVNITNIFTSDLIKDYGSAVKQHDNNRKSIAIRIFNENAFSRIIIFRNSVNDKFGYPLKFLNIQFARGRGKKFDYSDLSRSFENIKRISEIIKNAFSGLNPPRYGNYSNEMTSELSNKINDCINIWENAIKEYVPKKKRTKIGDKIIDHLYINLATAYFLNGELNKASDNLKKVKMNKGEIKEAKYFSSRLEDISNRLKLQ